MGRFAEGKALEKGLENATQINDKFGEGVVEFRYGAVTGTEGDGRAAIEHACRSIQLLEEARAAVLVGVAWLILGAGYRLIEEYETAKDHVKKGLKMQNEMSLPYGPELAHWVLASIHCVRSDIPKAREHAREALELSRRINSRNNEAMAHMVLGRALGRSEPAQGDAAEENIRQGIRIAKELRMKPYTASGYFLLGERYAGAGQPEKAVEALKKAEGMYLEMGLDIRNYWVARVQEVLGRL